MKKLIATLSVIPTHAVCAGWLHALFPVMVFAEKSKYTEARQEKSALHHRELAIT